MGDIVRSAEFQDRLLNNPKSITFVIKSKRIEIIWIINSNLLLNFFLCHFHVLHDHREYLKLVFVEC